MIAQTSVHDLKTLVLSFHPIIGIETVEEDRVTALLRAVAKEVAMPLYRWSVTKGLSRDPDPFGTASTRDPEKLLRHIEELADPAIYHLQDFAVHLKDPRTQRQLREVAQHFTIKRSTIVLTGASLTLPRDLDHLVLRYQFELPGPQELRAVVLAVIKSLRMRHRAEVELREADMQELLRALSGLTAQQARQAVAYTMIEDGKLDPGDIPKVLERKGRVVQDGGLLEYYPAQDNAFELGGFARLKEWLARARIGFTPAARELNLTAPRGVMLVGVQGCGKSLAAKCIAREWKLPLLKLEAGRLFNKYVGETEKNFDRAVQVAEAMAPVVLWIDEIEKCLVSHGSSEADAGLSRRLFGAFLTWLQEKRCEVFVVATANDLSLLPPELIRKGRFDEIFFVDLPTPAERKEIFRIHLRLRKQDPDRLDLDRLVQACEGFSGAEIEQAVVSSLYRSLHCKTALDTDLLQKELGDTLPLSVSRREDIERLRVFAQGRFATVH